MAVIEMNWRPSHRDLQVFAVVQLIVATVVAWLLHRRLGWDAAAIGLMAASLAGVGAGLASPRLLRPLFVAWMLAAFPIGWVMSHVLLASVYYGVVTPIGFALRLCGRDALQLTRRPDANTFWVVRPEPPEPPRYFQQF
jgi:saxitoxin biosynthesis operon SxtJ-like protein